jgi:hypothetical protein
MRLYSQQRAVAQGLSLEFLALDVDRLRRDANVADLPFDQPAYVKLAINLRTAKSFNLAIPPPSAPAPTR